MPCISRGMAQRSPLTVAVLNTSDDVVEMLRILFEESGYVVISTHLDDIKRGQTDFEQLIRQHRPSVIVYDIPPPYDKQWQFLEHMRALPVLKDLPFVLTTTNAARLKEIVGTTTEVHEIVGKPYDLDHILQAVNQAAGKRPPPEGRRAE